MKRILFFGIFFILFCNSIGYAQNDINLVDGRETQNCEECKLQIKRKPAEVLFGININANGDVYFTMTNKKWFDIIFKNEKYGLTIDLITRDRYKCSNKNEIDFTLPRGEMLEPIYKKAILKNASELIQGELYAKIGKVPSELRNKELEANLVILNGNSICYYTNFVDIDRAAWQLLPMGLFTDSIVNFTANFEQKTPPLFSYTKKIQVEIPFEKASAILNNNNINQIYDSLKLINYRVKKVEIRAYTSVEGSVKTNEILMQQRANAMKTILNKYGINLSNSKIIAAENWLEFYSDLKNTDYKNFIDLSKAEIKQKLADKSIAKELEPILAKHRKTIATFYLDEKSISSAVKNNDLLQKINLAISKKEITNARILNKEIMERIIDKTLPTEYIKNEIEVPQTKEFSYLLNDREVYKYLLKTTTEYEALENFKTIQTLDPYNSKVAYNICVLKFFLWQNWGDSISKNIVLNDINNLSFLNVDSTLIKRLLINFYILNSEEKMQEYDYFGKDTSVLFIQNTYKGLKLDDEDILSLAKYFTYYSKQFWAEEIVTPRVNKLDVSEDLVFYYINLMFFYHQTNDPELLNSAIINAINLNRKRYCNFFKSNNNGGASMQLLDNEFYRKIYCKECN